MIGTGFFKKKEGQKKLQKNRKKDTRNKQERRRMKNLCKNEVNIVSVQCFKPPPPPINTCCQASQRSAYICLQTMH